MKALVIDDSRLARRELAHLLKDFDLVHIIGEAANAEEAKLLIEKEKPDLIFLDIQMPGKNGFELLEELEYMPYIIFTTAYNEYAIKAFEYNALDYLMKPIQSKRLANALIKVGEKIQAKSEASEDQQRLSQNNQVFVKEGESCWFVQLADIRLFEVEGNHTRIYFGKEKPTISRTLNYLESRLDAKTFFRANRQQIINLNWVNRIEPWFSGSLKVFLKGGEEVEISRRQTQRFKELLSF